jgi:ATP-dependent DNA helicase RecG
MTEKEIQNILDQGEGVTVEFKSAGKELPKNLFETVCAFLNRNGGTILLGIGDSKKVTGIDLTQAEALCKDFASLSNNPNKIEPVFLLYPETVTYQGKKLIHVFVPASSQIHKTGGKIFDRSVDGDYWVKSDEQIRQLYLRKSSYFTESTIYPFLKESDFKQGILERVRKIIKVNRPAHPWNELTNDEFFRSTGLYRRDMQSGNEGFTMAALLLFGNDEVIQSALPHYKIDALVRIVDQDRYDDRENIKCNLIEAYDRLLEFTEKHLPDKFYMIGDQRISLREKIFREIIANMLIHREYTNAFPSSFIIYSDKVETRNANKPHIYGQLFPDTFQPYPKNPCLAQLFTQMGRSEELGTGLRNVYRYSRIYSGSDNIIFLEEDIFKAVIPLAARVTDKVTIRVTDNNKRIS